MIISYVRSFFWALFWRRRRRAPQSYKPVILVTGCGSGIGLALAEILHGQTQYRVVITAREASLIFLRRRFKQSERFLVRVLDVTHSSNREKLLEEISDLWGGIDILVNNAGIAYRAVVEHMTEKDEQLQIATNYLGPAALVRLVIPHMRANGRGKIINVSSVSGMLAMPTMASYSASKHALEGLSEALWYEMKPLGINVSLIQPGFIRSESFQRVRFTKMSNPLRMVSNRPYSDYYRHMSPFIGKLMGHSRATSKSVARKVLQAIRTENPPLWIPATIDAVGFYYLRRLLPRQLMLWLLFSALPGARSWATAYTNRRSRITTRKAA